MAVNRKLPFGYEMRGGSVALRSDEAAVVCMIYQQYAAGCSYAKLTQELNRQPVHYLPGKAWNKNMVARILADERYLGKKQFPLMIAPQLYQKARDRLPSKAPMRKKSEFTDMIQRLAVCGACGAKAGREPYSHGKERWFCSGCRTITAKVTDQRLEASVDQILETLIRSPQMVAQDTGSAAETVISVTTGEAAFRELLDIPNFDEALAKQMALDLAAARFDALGSKNYEGRRIQYVLANADAGKIYSPELLRQIADAVLIGPYGEVSLRLKNRQIIDWK